MKNGAEIVRFPKQPRDDVQKVLVDWAAYIAASFEPEELHGFCVTAWSNNATMTEIQIIKPESASINTAPAYVAEEVRRTLHRKGEW